MDEPVTAASPGACSPAVQHVMVVTSLLGRWPRAHWTTPVRDWAHVKTQGQDLTEGKKGRKSNDEETL